MVRSYLIDFYIRQLALARDKLSALAAEDGGVELLEAEIADLEARMEWAMANNS
jgi:hypothetical protein